MRRNQGPRYHLSYQKFKNAKWILKDKESGTISEKDYPEMATLVKDGYVSIKGKNITVRELYITGGTVIDGKWSVGISYTEILPNYTVIDCYDYKYQCKECERVFDEVRKRGEKKESEDYCISCRSWVKTH